MSKTMMSKIRDLKHAVANPPAARLAKTEYISHFLSLFGILAVCIFLIFKGFWYIIFALIFGVGVSYSQGMTALQKYRMIVTMQPKVKIEEFSNDISFSRRRAKIVGWAYGRIPSLVSIVFAILFSVFVVSHIVDSFLLKISLYPIIAILIYAFLYYFCFYELANIRYRKELKNNKL